ncbi:uncharacterized protein VDAG_05686 [Verticillium dahliae VdLs.17]|uniref:Uncharacterized protein n=1 Tax=Verticillium dahliae (strain VdLs.17 / ATCC MYA-4575 / FGSC 10137) TaxID=498257 RepID=G2X6A4_VERDV|nr:uncharacterized protein VDAG_05686 [Verticillium dahliae VdLs.17]EGY14522.1 hypothetical protein VDAG_05686 [Verticillium dahliae VdLs.17]
MTGRLALSPPSRTMGGQRGRLSLRRAEPPDSPDVLHTRLLRPPISEDSRARPQMGRVPVRLLFFLPPPPWLCRLSICLAPQSRTGSHGTPRQARKKPRVQSYVDES